MSEQDPSFPDNIDYKSLESKIKESIEQDEEQKKRQEIKSKAEKIFNEDEGMVQTEIVNFINLEKNLQMDYLSKFNREDSTNEGILLSPGAGEVTQGDDLMTTQEMSHILNNGINTTTFVLLGQKVNQAEGKKYVGAPPKSPIFKNHNPPRNGIGGNLAKP